MSWTESPRHLDDALDNLTEENFHKERKIIEEALEKRPTFPFPMTFVEYAQHAHKTAVYPGHREFTGLAYASLGLTGEAGECADKVKKLWRDNAANIDSAVFREELAKELGDVLWYVAAIASEIGYPLDLIAKMNVEKLASRHARDVLAGSGDNR